MTLEEMERRHLRAALDQAGWGIRAAARTLGIPESTLRFRLKKLGIRRT